MAQSLPIALYTGKQTREIDRTAIDDFGIDGFQLMQQAGKEAFNLICEHWLEELRYGIQIFCGGGNNGGDGYIIAGLAKEQGIPVSVVSLKSPDELKGDARKAWSFCRALGVEVTPFEESCKVSGGVMVDAMLGTGLQGKVSDLYQQAIELVNSAQAPVLAVDIPSGLCADTGAELGLAVKAVHTITFIGVKQGLLTAMGPDCCGKLSFSDLGVPQEVYKKQSPSSYRLCQNELMHLVKKRPAHAHKGIYGHVLVVGGNYGMPGAVIIAAEAAMACGAGRVTVATRAEHLGALAIRRPEVMAQAVNNVSDFQAMLQDKAVVIIGPGLGKGGWSRMLVKEALAASCPVLLDADALNLIADESELLCKRKLPIILTPHPGEAARLLGSDIKTVQNNRFSAVDRIKQQYAAITVLKGAGTLVCSNIGIKLCSVGNPGMAVAGIGDVLSGVIGALLGQEILAEEAACLGVWLHSSAADELVAEQGEVGVLATALIPYIRNRLNRLIVRGSY